MSQMVLSLGSFGNGFSKGSRIFFYGRAIKTGWGNKGPAIKAKRAFKKNYFRLPFEVPTAVKLYGGGVKALMARPSNYFLCFSNEVTIWGRLYYNHYIIIIFIYSAGVERERRGGAGRNPLQPQDGQPSKVKCRLGQL